MADKKISEMAAASAYTGANEFYEIVQGGNTRQGSHALLKTYLDTLYSPAVAIWSAHTYAGYGSTDTKIPYFSTVVENTDTASAFTVVNNSTNGCKVTINITGIYCFTFSAVFASAARAGLSLNSNQLTTDFASMTAAHRIAMDYALDPSSGVAVSVTRNFTAGDVIRPHASGVGADPVAFWFFSACRVR